MFRNYTYSRTLTAGCFECHGSEGHWFGPNAQGVAARHHDATGHKTWVDVCMSIRYGDTIEKPKKPQEAAPAGE